MSSDHQSMIRVLKCMKTQERTSLKVDFVFWQ